MEWINENGRVNEFQNLTVMYDSHRSLSFEFIGDFIKIWDGCE